MIIEWTYGALAQVQRYFGVGYWLTDSTVSFALVITSSRNIFLLDTERREFIKDIKRREIVKDVSRRIFNIE